MNNQDNFIMLPTNDFCFKELMQNPKVRKGFIAGVLGKNPEEIRETVLLPTETRRDYAEAKLAILDVKVLLHDGAQMDLEMQVEYFAFWDKRVLFYLAKMYTGQLQKGEGYDKLKKCIHVGVLNFVSFPESEECYHKINLCNTKTGEIYSDLFELHVLELPKLPKVLARMKCGEAVSGGTVIQWMEFFSGKTQEDFEAMAKQDEYMEEAVNTLFELSADEKKRYEYEAREMAIHDYNTLMGSAIKLAQDEARKKGLEQGKQEGIQQGIREGIQQGIQEGIQQGIQEGIQQGIQEGIQKGIQQGLELVLRVLKLKSEGKSAHQIAEECNVPLEQVEKIIEQ